MAKFAKLFENKEGDQLLLTIVNSEENEEVFGINHELESEDCRINVKISGLNEQQAKHYLDNFEQSRAEEILADPIKFFM